MNIIFLLTTAFIVSIDSLICGFSLAVNCAKKFRVVLCIVSTVTAMCLCAYFFGAFLEDALTENVTCYGGAILIGIGVFNLVTAGKEKAETRGANLTAQGLLLGAGVGTDGAFATFSLTIMGYRSVYVPLTVSAMHFLTVGLGIALASSKISVPFRKYRFIPPLILIAMGLYKLSGIIF